ncbi:hypothetical protein, partial [Streptacidiphilus cavernicola]
MHRPNPPPTQGRGELRDQPLTTRTPRTNPSPHPPGGPVHLIDHHTHSIATPHHPLTPEAFASLLTE